jgi:dienelactone hydrolase
VSSRDLIEVADFNGIDLSPDGKYVAFELVTRSVNDNKIILEWYVAPLSGDHGARKVADGGEPIWVPGYGLLSNELPVWSPDSRSFYFRCLKRGELAIWNATVEGKVRKITHDASDIMAFVLGSNGRQTYYEAGATRDAVLRAEEEEAVEGVILTPAVMVHDILLHNYPHGGRMATMRRAIHRRSSEYLGTLTPLLEDAPVILKVLDLATGVSHIASGTEREEYKQLTPKRSIAAAFAAGVALTYTEKLSGSSLFAIAAPINVPSNGTQSHGRTVPYYQLRWTEAGSKREETCTAPPCTTNRLRGLRWRPGSREILFISDSPSGAATLYGWDTEHNSVRVIVSSNGLLGSFGEDFHRIISSMCPVTQAYAVCTTASADSPPRLEKIDLTTGRRHTIFDPNLRLRHPSLGRTEYLTWKDKWGRDVTGVLVLPRNYDGQERLPLVITSYLCQGFLRGGAGSAVPEHLLAENGIAALCVNFDTTERYGQPYPSGEFPTGDQANLQSNLDGWESGVVLLEGRGIVNPEKIGISGSSFGSDAVHYATLFSKRFRVAAACQPPVTDPIDYYLLAAEGDLGKLNLAYFNMPPPEQDTAGFYKKFSPALNASKISVPVLIQSAESEFRFGIQYYAAMLAENKPLEFIVFPGESHNFMQPSHRLVRSDRFIDWFKFWLVGQVGPDPAKNEQYGRWRELRRQHEEDMKKLSRVPPN